MIYKSELLEAIIEGVSLLVADLETGEILYASRPLEELFGYYIRNELTGRCVDELLPENMRVSHVAHRQTFAQQPRVRPMGAGLNVSGQRNGGEVFPVEVTLSAAVISGKKCVVVTVISMEKRLNKKPA